MQPSDMDRKREAFLEHLKQKYPHHAVAIMGHQERLREQVRLPTFGCQGGASGGMGHILKYLTHKCPYISSWRHFLRRER